MIDREFERRDLVFLSADKSLHLAPLLVRQGSPIRPGSIREIAVIFLRQRLSFARVTAAHIRHARFIGSGRRSGTRAAFPAFKAPGFLGVTLFQRFRLGSMALVEIFLAELNGSSHQRRRFGALVEGCSLGGLPIFQPCLLYTSRCV